MRAYTCVVVSTYGANLATCTVTIYYTHALKRVGISAKGAAKTKRLRAAVGRVPSLALEGASFADPRAWRHLPQRGPRRVAVITKVSGPEAEEGGRTAAKLALMGGREEMVSTAGIMRSPQTAGRRRIKITLHRFPLGIRKGTIESEIPSIERKNAHAPPLCPGPPPNTVP